MISGGSTEDNHAAVDLAAIEAETRELGAPRKSIAAASAIRVSPRRAERADTDLEQAVARRAKPSEMPTNAAAVSRAPSSQSCSRKPTAAIRAAD